LDPKTRRRHRGDKKDDDVGHLEQGNKKTSVVVDVVTTSVGGAGRRAGTVQLVPGVLEPSSSGSE
jgi:hypothetical protein